MLQIESLHHAAERVAPRVVYDTYTAAGFVPENAPSYFIGQVQDELEAALVAEGFDAQDVEAYFLCLKFLLAHGWGSDDDV